MANNSSTIRYCYRCGSDIPSDASFCRKCGYRMPMSAQESLKKELLDCRQTKTAIYLSEEQAQRGGIVKYFFDEQQQYVDIDIEPGIVSKTEKKVLLEYKNRVGETIRAIRNVKVYVGFGPDSTNNSHLNNLNGKKEKTKNHRPYILIFIGFAVMVCLVVGTVSKTPYTSPTAASSETLQSTQPSDGKVSEATSFVQTDISDIIPHYESRYYLNNLDPSLVEDAKALYVGIKEFKYTIKLPRWTTIENVDLLISVLKYDCPELFQVSDKEQYTYTITNGKVNAVHLPYSMTKAEYNERIEKCNDLIRRLATTVGYRSEESKEEYVYEYLTDRVTYNTTKANCGNAYGALINNAAKCDGISLAAKWIFEEMGISSFVITGQEKGDPYGHAWNCVNINGSYYDLDLTNDLKSSDRVMKLYGAYNVKRSWLSDIYPISSFITKHYSLPESKTMSHSYHVLNGSYISAGSDIRSQIFRLLDEAAEYEDFGFIQFERDSDYQTFMRNYESYIEDWFDDNRYGGGFKLSTLSELRTVGFELDIDY